MVIKRQKPTIDLMGRIASDYYLECEKRNGKSPFRLLSLAKCRQGDVNSRVLKAIDENYEQASNQFNTAYYDYFCDFVGLYADNDFLIAHATVIVSEAVDGKLVAQISEILINDKEELLGNPAEGKLDWVYGIYREMIKAIEEMISIRYQNVERIDLISLAQDSDFWEVTELLGYDINDSGDLPYNQCRFSKYVNERNARYERNIVTEQSSE